MEPSLCTQDLTWMDWNLEIDTANYSSPPKKKKKKNQYTAHIQ